MSETLKYRPAGALSHAAAQTQMVQLISRVLMYEGNSARIVRIDALQDFFDRRWPHVEQEVRQRMAEILTTVVGDTGAWLPYNDTTYLLLPPRDQVFDDADLAQHLTALQQNLAGNAYTEPLITLWQPQAETDDGWAFAPLVSSVQPGAGTSPRPAQTETPSPAPTQPEAPPPAPPKAAAAKEATQPQRPSNYKVVGGLDTQFVIDGAAEDESARAPGTEKIDGQLVFADIELTYAPIWEVRRNAVFAYLCEPYWLTPDGQYRHEEAVDSAFKNERARLAVDLTVLHKTHEAFDELLEHDRLSSIILPVHYDTLADAMFENRYIDECHRIVGGFHEFICFEIIGLPDNIDKQTFSEITASIRPYCRALLVRVPIGMKNVENLINPDVFAVSVNLRGDARRESEIITDLKALQDQINAGGGGYSCAYGLTSKSLSVASICEGFDLIGSDIIASALEGWPMDDYLVQPIDLYHQLLSR